MVMILTAGLLVMAVSLAFVWYVCAQAPEGFEDQTGFHVTAVPENAAKSASQKLPAALKTRNDHEPIAA